MTFAVIGPKGTFSCEIAEKIREENEEILLFSTIRDVFTAVLEKNIRGIVPVENSEAGGVGETLDGLLQTECRIAAEYYMPIRHFFVSRYELDEISVIYTHSKSHEQCSLYLNCLKDAAIIHTSSNAQSAKEAAAVSRSAAVRQKAQRNCMVCRYCRKISRTQKTIPPGFLR